MATQGIIPRISSSTRGPRVEVKPVVYVNWSAEPAFLLNLSERGLAVQAMEVLEPGQTMPVTFPLPDTPSEVHGVARIVWSDRSGRAGLEFTNVSEFDRFCLQQWITQNRNN